MTAKEFLQKHQMNPERVDPAECVAGFLGAMEAGLRGDKSGLPMEPTFLKSSGAPREGLPAAVIDAGGTNFRRALVTFTPRGAQISELKKSAMPGVGAPVTFDEFIAFTADETEPLADSAAHIGFCFSYMADITPERDGKSPRFTKQVKISGGEGRLICAALAEELSKRGISGKSFTLLNDTAAVLLGVGSGLDKSKFDGLIGFVCGTGINTCCTLPAAKIPKIRAEGELIVNLESGYYDGLPRGDVDFELDAAGSNPGRCLHEKMVSGAYIGELVRRCLELAVREGVIEAAPPCADTAAADELASGEAGFARDIALAMFERAARCAAANLAAVMELTDAGRSAPACICAEGSMFLKGRHFRPLLEKYLTECTAPRGRAFVFATAEDTTLKGAAAAALLNQ